MALVERLEKVELPPLRFGRQMGIVDVLDYRLRIDAAIVDVAPLENTGQEAVAPQLRTDDRLARTEHHVTRQVLILRPQPIAQPTAQTRPRRLRVAGIHHQ